MKYLLIAMLVSMPLYAQDCVYPPVGKKIVFVPWFVPVDEITWLSHPATEPIPECDPDALVVSPGAPCEEEE